MDSANYVTFMLMDKGYYDYDYHDYGDAVRAQQNAVKNDDDLKALLQHLGVGKAEARSESEAEALQKMAMENEK